MVRDDYLSRMFRYLQSVPRLHTTYIYINLPDVCNVVSDDSKSLFAETRFFVVPPFQYYNAEFYLGPINVNVTNYHVTEYYPQ